MPTDAKPKLKPTVNKAEPDHGLTQCERFITVAQELGADDDPEQSVERVRKLAKAPISEQADKSVTAKIRK